MAPAQRGLDGGTFWLGSVMDKQIKLLTKDDVIWTLVDGELIGWKVQESGNLVRLANWERTKIIEEAPRV
jgi:hypothetical protein